MISSSSLINTDKYKCETFFEEVMRSEWLSCSRDGAI